jgi:hypothetical protein
MIIFMKFDERNKKKLKSPLFYFHCNCSKVCSTDSDFFGLSLPWKQKRGDLIFFLFFSSNFMKLCKNIHCSVWQLLGLNKFKMAAIAMEMAKMKMPHTTVDISTKFHEV